MMWDKSAYGHLPAVSDALRTSETQRKERLRCHEEMEPDLPGWDHALDEEVEPEAEVEAEGPGEAAWAAPAQAPVEIASAQVVAGLSPTSAARHATGRSARIVARHLPGKGSPW